MRTKRTPAGRWRAWGWHRGHRIDASGKTKRAAEDRWLAKREALDKSAVAPASRRGREAMTVDEAVRVALAEHSSRVTDRTAARYTQAWASHGGELGEVLVVEVTPAELRRWLANVTGSRKHARLALALGLDFAVQAELLDRNPLDEVKAPRARGGRPTPAEHERKVYTPAEVEALTRVAREDPTAVASRVWLIGISTGMRIGEIGGLQWRDLVQDGLQVRRQRDRGKLVERLKTANSRRTVRVTEGLRELLGTPGRADDWIVDVGSDPRSAWARLHERAGVELRRGAPFHAMRHTHATTLLYEGVPVSAVASRLGDTVATVVSHYSHVLAELDERWADTISAVAGRAIEPGPSL